MTGWAKAILKLFLFQREKIQVTRFHLFRFQLIIVSSCVASIHLNKGIFEVAILQNKVQTSLNA